MSRVRTRWFVPVVASIAMILSQSATAALVATPAYAAGPSFSATDSSKVPHYFGPYPNWANSPQTLSDAIVTLQKVAASPVGVGNALIGRAFATDYVTAPGTLAQVFVAVSYTHLTLP